jgi:hypothetical protein
MKKLILTGTAIAMLAVPAASMASAPANPGGFGQERATNIGTVISGADWGHLAADRAGTNGDQNQDWMQAYGYLPAESNAGL